MEKLDDLIHQIKQSEEYISYINAKQDLSDVSKGGKYYHECSFMDISVRIDRLEDRKKELITFIGSFVLDKIESRSCENCKYNKEQDDFMIFCDKEMCQDNSKMMWHSFTKDFCCKYWESK